MRRAIANQRGRTCRGPVEGWREASLRVDRFERTTSNMANANLSDAETYLREIIFGLNPGEQLVVVQNGVPLATLTRNRPTQWPCTAGTAKNSKHWMAPDFDAPLEEFREYME